MAVMLRGLLCFVYLLAIFLRGGLCVTASRIETQVWGLGTDPDKRYEETLYVDLLFRHFV